MLEFLLEALLYLLLEFLGEALTHLPLKWAVGRTTWSHLLLGTLFLVLGAALGWGTVLIYPRRLAPDRPITGLSVLLAPMVAAIAMHAIGRARAPASPPTPTLFSFWYAFDFAFGAAVARLYYFS